MEQDFSGTSGQTGSSGRGGQATEQARRQGQHVAQQARQQANQLAAQGRQQAKSQLAARKDQVAERLTPIQAALHETAQQLRNQDQDSMGQYADQAADQVERFSGYLRESDVDQLIGEAQGFARSRPTVFLGAAVALGFLATRFLKSSSQEGAYAGGGSGVSPTSGEVGTSYGNGEPATALPPDATVEAEFPTAGRPLTERERTEGVGEPTEPPRNFRGSDAG